MMKRILERDSRTDLIITPPERRWVLIFSILAMSATMLPYLLGFVSQGLEWRFTGFIVGVEDGNSYIAKMLSGSAGDWLFYTPYTFHFQDGVIAFLPYILLGKLASIEHPHLQLVLLYHIFRFIAGAFSIWVTYDFISIFIERRYLRRFGLVLITLGGGLGWLLVLVGKPYWSGALPLEFYSPESFGFLSLFSLPHLAMARALLLSGLVYYLLASRRKLSSSLIPGLQAGGLFLLLGFFQPLTVVVAWIVIAAHWISMIVKETIDTKKFELIPRADILVFLRNGIVSIVVSSPIVVYTYVKFTIDPFLRQWSEQNLIISPEPGHYLLAYGLLIPFSALGIYQLLKRKTNLGLLPLSWALMLPILAYAPYNLQRRLPEGIWVAVVVLAMVGVERIIAAKKQYSSKFLLYPFLLLALPSTIIIFAGGIQAVIHPGTPVFRPVWEVQSFQFLKENSKIAQIVLASYDTGNALPAWVPVNVVVGHGPESVGLEDLLPRVENFYKKITEDGERLEFLAETNADYVFWGPAERALGDWNPNSASYLENIYDHEEYTIFEVKGQN